MKEGDIIEWRGANRIHRGKVIKSDASPEGFIVKLDNGCTFQLKDLRYSSTGRRIEVWYTSVSIQAPTPGLPSGIARHRHSLSWQPSPSTRHCSRSRTTTMTTRDCPTSALSLRMPGRGPGLAEIRTPMRNSRVQDQSRGTAAFGRTSARITRYHSLRSHR